MLKECVVLDGVIINVGEWDYQKYKDITNNPLPLGAIIESRDFEYNIDFGWREVGILSQSTEIERIITLETVQAEVIRILSEVIV